METLQTLASLRGRSLLLAKARKFSGQAGYYLAGGRWHAFNKKQGKPAPKGSPQAAHPQAAGVHKPVEHFSDTEWEQLKLPPENTNAGSFNKQLANIKAMADAGQVSGILGMQFGTNTYGKKAAIIANKILELYGVENKVTPGQKAGEHPAVQNAPAAQAKPDQPLDHPKFTETKQTAGAADYYSRVSGKIADALAAGDLAGLEKLKADGLKSGADGKVSNTWAGKTANSKKLLKFYDEAWKLLSAPSAAPGQDAVIEAKPKAAAEPAPKKAASPKAAKKKPAAAPAEKPKQEGAATPAAAALDLIPWDSLILSPSNTNAKSHNGKVAQIKAMAYAGDVAGLEAFKAGTNTYGTKQNLLAQTALAALKESGEAKAVAKPLTSKTTTGSDDGPKDGDTKPGADGMLVFKNGRWHKMDEAKPAPTGKLSPTKAASLGKNLHIAPTTKSKLKSMAVRGDGTGLQKFIAENPHMDNATSYATALLDAMAAVKPKPSPKKAKAGKANLAPGPIEDMDGWEQTGGQGGSNPGGKFKDQNGVEWYCKFPADEGHARSEVLAAQLYAAAGVAGQDAKLIRKGGKIGIASRWTDVTKAPPATLAKTPGAAAGFAVDAWLGNWDAVGQDYDNLQVGPDGKAIRVDAGGSLEYRAQGAKKAFTEHVTEIDSLRDNAINPQSAAVFGKLTKADITASVKRVLKVPDSTIKSLVEQYHGGTPAEKEALAATLIARKADLASKFPKAVEKKKAKPFKPEKLSAPPSFLNWSGSGKPGPSSKMFLNEANEAAVQAIYAAAKSGSVEEVTSLEAAVYDKDTGQQVGAAKVLEHPSQHVQSYAQQVINEINYQRNPPKRFRFEGGHALHALDASYPPYKGPAHAKSVARIGKFIVLGEPGIVELEAMGLKKLTHAAGAVSASTYSAAAQAAIDKMPATQRQAVKAYTGSGYQSMNQSLWAGNPSGQAKSAKQALKTLGHEIAPGTVLSRKLSVSQTELQQLMNSAGKLLMEPAIMSTSIRPSSWGGNVQLKLHVGPGVKGLWVGKGSMKGGGALSNHPGEDEMVLPPNTRLLIIGTKKGADADGFGTSPQHVVEAIILPTGD